MTSFMEFMKRFCGSSTVDRTGGIERAEGVDAAQSVLGASKALCQTLA